MVLELPFDQLAEIVDAVGDKVDVICDGGIRRGTHVLKALSWERRLVQEVECIYTRWPLQVRRCVSSDGLNARGIDSWYEVDGV